MPFTGGIRGRGIFLRQLWREFFFKDSFWHMLPDQPPKELEHIWPQWLITLENMDLAHKGCADLNLFTDKQPLTHVFRKFLIDNGIGGKALDIGCGPTADFPAYLKGINGMDLYGVDPLPGAPERIYPFWRTMAEALPFAEATFDAAIFCSSIDHVLDQYLALKEAARVLNPGGKLFIMADYIDDNPRTGTNSQVKRLWHLIFRGTRQVINSIRFQGIKGTVRYLWLLKGMQMPGDADDYFHLTLPATGTILGYLEQLGFGDIHSSVESDQILVAATKTGQA